MMKNREERAFIFYLAAVLLFFALSFGSGFTRIYGFTLFPDEFGYWSSAAAAAGYDWSKVTAHGSYYSFGYALILIPILIVCHQALWVYRVALIVNTLLLAAAFVLLQGIVGKLIPRSVPVQRVLSAGIAVCYPVWLLYRNMTMAEVLLAFCFVLLCFLMLRYLERPSFGRFTAAGLNAVYMYTVHMRSLPILCACIGCMTAVWLGGMKNQRMEFCRFGNDLDSAETRAVPHMVRRHLQWCGLAGALAVVGASVLAAAYIKGWTRAAVYGKADSAMLAVNDYGGQITRVKSLFSHSGILEFAVSLTGKLYYLSAASFGLFFAGIWFFCKKIMEKSADFRDRIFALFFLLSTAGEILVCAVYTKGYGRIDGLCYGRYDELILPVLMAVGCFAVTQMRHPLRYAAAVILGGVLVTAMLEALIQSKGLTDINGGYFISGLSYLLGYIPFEPEHYFWKAYAFAAILTFLLTGILLLVRRKKEYRWLLLVWIGMETLLGMSLSEQMVYSQSRVRYRDTRMVSALKELSGENGTAEEERGRRIVCYGGDDAGNYAAVVQFELREETICFFSPEETDMLTEYDLVMACEKEDRNMLAERYSEHEVYGIFHLYYNE